MPSPAGAHRPWYRDLVLVSGLSLIALGIGNWATGSARLREHAEDIVQLEASRAARADAPVQAELEVARARMDFYHVVTSGGRFMTASGIVVSAFALARSLRGEARRSAKRQSTATRSR